MQRDGRSFTVEVTADGEGLVSHAGTALLSQVADKCGLTRALSRELAPMRERRSGHDPGRVLRDLAVMLADGGEALTDLGALREQAPLFGAVASDSTAYRAIERIARDPELLDGLRSARKTGPRARLGARPRPRAGDDRPRRDPPGRPLREGGRGGELQGRLRLPSRCSPTSTSPRRPRPGCCGPGNAGANTAADQIAVAEAALEQIPAERVEGIEVLLRVDSAGAVHELLEWAREGDIGFSVGFDLTEPVREAIARIPEERWAPAQDQDGAARENGEVAEAHRPDRPLAAGPRARG